MHGMSIPHRDVSRLAALRLAAAAGCDPRTAEKVLREGPDSIRAVYLRERLETAMGELGLAAPAAVRVGD
jgi:hypothetical protein